MNERLHQAQYHRQQKEQRKKEMKVIHRLSTILVFFWLTAVVVVVDVTAHCPYQTKEKGSSLRQRRTTTSTAESRTLQWGSQHPEFTSLLSAADYYSASFVAPSESTATVAVSSEGTKSIMNVQNGDWMRYSVGIPEQGEYTLSLRVASPVEGGSVQVISVDTRAVIATVTDLPSTGSDTTWTTVSTNLTLPMGMHMLELLVVQGGWSLQWMNLVSINGAMESPGVPVNAPVTSTPVVATPVTTSAPTQTPAAAATPVTMAPVVATAPTAPAPTPVASPVTLVPTLTPVAAPVTSAPVAAAPVAASLPTAPAPNAAPVVAPVPTAPTPTSIAPTIPSVVLPMAPEAMPPLFSPLAAPVAVPTASPVAAPAGVPLPTSSPVMASVPVATPVASPVAVPTVPTPAATPAASPVSAPTAVPPVSMLPPVTTPDECTLFINASNYSSMSGVNYDNTTDYIGWLDAGDWIVYNVPLPPKTYQLDTTAASPQGEGSFLLVDAVMQTPLMLQSDIPLTGNWTTWSVASTIFALPASSMATTAPFQLEMRIYSGGWNLKSLCFRETTAAVPVFEVPGPPTMEPTVATMSRTSSEMPVRPPHDCSSPF